MRRLALLGFVACASEAAPPPTTTPPVVLVEGACVVAELAPDYLSEVACKRDFEALASVPFDTSIPGARSVKVVYDRGAGDVLYFQNSQKYAIHHAFAAAQLSGNGKPIVPTLSSFNQTEYYAPDRRFLLGAVTHYEGPDAWVLEIAPYDTASAEMITALFERVRAKSWFGPALRFHPTSAAVALEATKLGAGVSILTTEEIFAGIAYQPLNPATAIGRLRFLSASELATTYVGYRDLVVLDNVPNDITVVAGIITEAPQTPLSHINVLSRNRRTPNMALKGAMTNATLRALEGQWVELTVAATEWTARAVTSSVAEAFAAAHRPEPVVLQAVDLSVRELTDLRDVVKESPELPLRDAIKAAIPAWGGKTAHYSVMLNTQGIPIRPGFAIPAYYYYRFMEDNGLWARLATLLADPSFRDDAAVRDRELAAFRAALVAAPLDPTFVAALRAKMEADFPGQSLRFRTSTNSEDLDGFPCAGCYESHTGDPNKSWEDVELAVKESWASIWLFRTFEERAYNGIDHASVVMALLVHRNFPDEEANGVAVTANPFDPSGLQPGYFINVQFGGDVEVVHPPAGTTSDQIIYLYDQPGQPVIYVSRSNIVAEGATVLTAAQLHELGAALQKIHQRFSPAYGPAAGNDGWYAMDVEFKFDGAEGETPKLWVKQARPYPGPEE